MCSLIYDPIYVIPVNSSENDQYLYGTKVSVTINEAAIPSGYVFKGWSVDGGSEICSYQKTYSFHIYTDTAVTPVFTTDVDFTPSPIVTATGIVNASTGKATIITTREIPDGYQVTSHGFVATKSEAYKNNLTIESVDGSTVIIRTATDYTYANNDYQASTTLSNGSSVYFAGYLTYIDSATGESHTIYTDVQTATMPLTTES